MRLRSWLMVVVSVIVLTALGIVGIAVNRSALRAADEVHRKDASALGRNNTILAGQLQLLSARELRDAADGYGFALRPGDLGDRSRLRRLVGRSDFFTYAAALTDLSGRLLIASRGSGLPPPDDPRLQALRGQLLSGQAGFSPVITSGSVTLSAVAVPVLVDDRPRAVLIGFTEHRRGQLQSYVQKLSAPEESIAVVDGAGVIAAATDAAAIGSTVDPPVLAALRGPPPGDLLEYRSGDVEKVAVIVGGIPGGWFYVRTQTRESFDGVVSRRHQTTTLTLLSMLVIGIAGVFLLGYRVQSQRRRSDQRFRALVQHAPDVVAVLDVNGRLTYVSPSAARLLDVPEAQLTGISVFALVHPEDRQRMEDHFRSLLEQPGGLLREQCRVWTGERTVRWLELTASNQTGNTALNGIVVNGRDVTDSRILQEQLAHEATHDPLTGLANRRHLNETLRAFLREYAVAVLFLDLDGFKQINDAFGHEAGDEVLREVAGRLRDELRPPEVLARMGGDEFVVLMPGVVRWFEADAVAQRLRRVIGAPIAVGAAVLSVSASVGVHVATPADNPDHVLRAADHAMYAVKHADA